jgi:hypothetical protein
MHEVLAKIITHISNLLILKHWNQFCHYQWQKCLTLVDWTLTFQKLGYGWYLLAFYVYLHLPRTYRVISVNIQSYANTTPYFAPWQVMIRRSTSHKPSITFLNKSLLLNLFSEYIWFKFISDKHHMTVFIVEWKMARINFRAMVDTSPEAPFTNELFLWRFTCYNLLRTTQ